MDFILSSVGRLESEKHSLALKEVVALTRRYPHLLTANLINRVSNLEEGGITTSPATKTCILELKSEYHSRYTLFECRGWDMKKIAHLTVLKRLGF